MKLLEPPLEPPAADIPTPDEADEPSPFVAMLPLAPHAARTL
jgi:hypothetical protein